MSSLKPVEVKAGGSFGGHSVLRMKKPRCWVVNGIALDRLDSYHETVPWSTGNGCTFRDEFFKSCIVPCYLNRLTNGNKAEHGNGPVNARSELRALHHRLPDIHNLLTQHCVYYTHTGGVVRKRGREGERI